MDRATRCIVGWAVSPERDLELLQSLIDKASQAHFYYSDLYAGWRGLLYWSGIHTPMPNKRETFRVEGNNAELRRYLARLARSSRCFSRSITALWRAIKLFVFVWNQRQLYAQRYPAYPAHLIQFV